VDAVRKLVPAIVAVLACAACAVPVFDPAMSASVATFRASHAIGTSYPTIGPDTNTDGEPDFDLKEDTLVFMPQRWDGIIDRFNGFVIRRPKWDNWNQVWYQWWDGSKVRWMDTPASFQEEEGLRWRWPVSMKGGSYLGAIIFDWSDLNTNVERLSADTLTPDCTWNPPLGTYDPGADLRSELGLGSEPVIVGLSMNPLSGANDRIHALVRVNDQFSEAWADISALTADPDFSVSISPISYFIPFLTTPRHLNYARDDSTAARSFVQWQVKDAWHTGAWKGSTVQPAIDFDEPSAIDHRIDAVLTTEPIWGWPFGSYLLSTEKQIGRIYHYNGPGTGSQVAEFGLGTLNFIGQVFLGTEWQLVFTRTLVDRTTSPARVRFEIRGIYTKDLLAEFGL
jgi:hypothetical protein